LGAYFPQNGMVRINARAREEAEHAEWEAKREAMSEAWEAEWEAMSEGQRAEWDETEVESARDYATAMADALDAQEWDAERSAHHAAEQPKWEVNYAKMVAHIEQHGRIPKSAWVRWQRYEGGTRPVCEHHKNPFHEARVQMLEALPLWRCAKRAVLQAREPLFCPSRKQVDDEVGSEAGGCR
jgi:hypothetical protein